MGLRIFKRNNIWYAEIDRKRFSLKTSDEKVALKSLNYLIDILSKPKPIRINKFVDEMVEWAWNNKPKQYLDRWRNVLNIFKEYFGPNLNMNDLITDHIYKFMDDLSYSYSPSTINHIVCNLKSIFNKAKYLELLGHNPFTKIKLINLSSIEIDNEDWLKIKAQHRHKCASCGKHENEVNLTKDHIYPRSYGGKLSKKNVQPLCRSCNSKKGAKFVDFRDPRTNCGHPILTEENLQKISNAFKF